MRTVKESSLYLFGQQLLAQCVKCDKLPRQHPRVYEALGHQHDFTDQLEVWYHHGARSVGGGGYKNKLKNKNQRCLAVIPFYQGRMWKEVLLCTRSTFFRQSTR